MTKKPQPAAKRMVSSMSLPLEKTLRDERQAFLDAE